MSGVPNIKSSRRVNPSGPLLGVRTLKPFSPSFPGNGAGGFFIGRDAQRQALHLTARNRLSLSSNDKATAPLFNDKRVEDFYQESRLQGINYEELSSLLGEVFKFDKYQQRKVPFLLKAHSHLSEDFAREISEAIQRYLDGKPPRADRNADVILRFDKFEEQGALGSTRQDLVWVLEKSGKTIGKIQPYAIEGKLLVKEARMRELSKEALYILDSHKLRSMIEEFIEIAGADLNGLFFDLIEEERIPKKLRRDLLQRLGLSYNPETAELRKKDDSSFDLYDDSLELVNIISALIAELGNKSLSDPSIQSAYCEHLMVFLIHYMKRYPHFLENLQGMEKIIDQPWEESDAKSFYDHTREILLHGILDYPFDELLPAVRKLIGSFFPQEGEVREKLKSWGEDVPEGPLSSSWISECANAYLIESKRLRDEGKKKEANRVYGRYVYLNNVDFSAAEEIQKISKWGDIFTQVPKILKKSNSDLAKENAARAFRFFTKLNKDLRINLDSFGKYFEEIEKEGEVEIWMVPVKGIAAAIAIDSGSDCGKGRATNRALVDEYTVYLLTNKERTKLWGYVGFYEVDGDGKLVLQVDAMNPSTRLDLSGTSFLNQIKNHFSVVAKSSAKQDRQIAAFLASNDPALVSNRTSISDKILKFLGENAKRIFSELNPRLPEIENIGLAGQEKTLEELQEERKNIERKLRKAIELLQDADESLRYLNEELIDPSYKFDKDDKMMDDYYAIYQNPTFREEIGKWEEINDSEDFPLARGLSIDTVLLMDFLSRMRDIFAGYFIGFDEIIESIEKAGRLIEENRGRATKIDDEINKIKNYRNEYTNWQADPDDSSIFYMA